MKKEMEMLTYSAGEFRIPDGPVIRADTVTVRDDFKRQFYTREDESPDWTLTETVSRKKGTIRRKFRVKLRKGRPFRSISLELLLEYPGQGGGLSGWNVFTGRLDFPETVYFAGARKVYYGDVCYGTVLPMLSLYHSGRNCGMTVAADPGVFPGGRLAFSIDHYYGKGIHACFEDMALSEDRPVEVELIFYAHVGCYRPALARFIELFPDFFYPAVPALEKMTVFGISNPFTKENYIRRSGMDFSELHNHFPHYGEYAPETEAWDSVVRHDYPAFSAETPGKITHEKINERTACLQKHGVNALLYLQISGDGLLPWAEKYFASSMAKDRHGRPYPTWKECCMVNADPSTPFGRHIEKMIPRFLRLHPDIDGVFLDQPCYFFYDFAHDDGRSAVENRPVYSYGQSYMKHAEVLAKTLHRAGKPVLANGPFHLGIARYSDGIMAEGTEGLSETLKYLCLKKPLLVHTYPTDAEKTESMFRYALLTAAAISVGGSSTLRNPPPFPPEVKELFARYMPLIRALHGSHVLLEPSPLTFDAGLKGEIFRASSEEYLVAILREKAGAVTRKFHFTALTPPGGHPSVLTRGTENRRWKKVPFELKDDGRVSVTLDGRSNAYVVKITA